MSPDDKPTEQQQERQLTQPKKGEPVEIPVPKRKDVLVALEKAALGPTDGAKRRRRRVQ